MMAEDRVDRGHSARRKPVTNGISRITVAIPTFNREKVLIETIGAVLALEYSPAEILILDQTEHHETATEQALANWQDEGQIRRLQLPNPSITKAMNRALMEANQDIVLFLDDDITPEPDLIAAHMEAHQQAGGVLIAGRVIQPWQEGRGQEGQDFSNDTEFHFASTRRARIDTFMGGNFSVDREQAIALGGFDENFVEVAYHFEREFAHRWCKAGFGIYFEPAACIHHLKVTDGGTRSFGAHLTTVRPSHSVGAYYYYLMTWSGWETMKHFAGRPFRAVATRHHLRKPWWIPATLMAEFGGMIWALYLAWRGPCYVAKGAILRDD